MKVFIRFCSVFFLILAMFSAKGQYSQLLKADTEFQLKNYAKAVTLYQKVLDSEKDKGETAIIYKKIGECFNEINQYDKAIEYFESYISLDPNSGNDIKYQYADLLLKSGNVIKARSIFTDLLEASPGNEEVERMIACCNFAIAEMEKSNKPPIQNQKLINSAQSEFGLAFFNDQLIFASQLLNDDYSSIHGRTNEGFSDFFIAGFDTTFNMFNDAERLPGNINSPYNEGTFTYNSGLNTAFFTQCKKNPDLCKILNAKYEKNKWVDIKEVSLGQPDYNFAHPSLSSDGKTLYFASDLPGGLGGKDIWKASVSLNGEIGVPVHLGNSINTSKDDMFPLIIGDSILMFASEGHVGMGGLDIFYSKIDEGLYDRSINVGAPINSTGDDFSILVNPDLNGGYFCSNGNNPEQSDDIFAFFHNIFLKDIFGKVLDSLTFKPVDDVRITYSTNEVAENIVYTDSLGNFSVPYTAHTNCEKNHKLDFEKEGYFPKNVEVPCHAKEGMIVFLDDGSGIFHTLIGNILDKNNGMPVEGAMVTIKSLRGLNDSTYTDSNGRFSFEKIPPDDYIILRASKENYLSDSKLLQSPDKGKKVTLSEDTGYDTNFELVPNRIGIKVELEDIFYEFDKASLLPESEASLNKLVNLLNENPNVKIQINSHTDERGSNSYNFDLSNRRGAGVVNYLIKAGINKSVLISRGFGETQFRIKNASTEEEHQQNRRTEFEIIGQVTIAVSGTRTTYSIPESSIKKDEDEKLFDRIREVNKEGDNITGDSMLEFKIKVGLEDSKENQVEVESGELIKVDQGELVKTSPEKPVVKKEEPKVADKPVTQTVKEPETKIEKEETPPPTKTSIPVTVYRVQIIATGKTLDVKSTFAKISDLIDKHGVSVEKVKGLNKYQLGNFDNQNQATGLKEILYQRGYKDCFVVAVKK